MILVDANLLIYAYNSSVDVHERARAWLEDALSGGIPVGLQWSTIHAFLRLMTQQALFPEPLNIAEATAIVESWLAQPIVMDAHLAALAVENDAILYTTDRDFRRFEGVQVRNPLIP